MSAATGTAPGPAAPAAELEDVARHYPGGVRALDGVSVRIEAGELVGIVGPSGSGKSTLLNLLGTLDTPTAGAIRIGGHDVGALGDDARSALRATGIGFVFQQFHLAANITALDNVADGLLYTGLPMRRRREKAAAALRRVGMADRAGHRPHELSGGQQQRTAIARAVAGDPALILADEPTGALDTATGEVVIGLLRELNAEGAAVVVITHDREVAAGLPRRIQVRDGRIAADERTDGARSAAVGGVRP
ncbi:putative ABC transport system ATP-binding protein [Murinocardiopsis flavida]|uniref:Putative ABC transport system ATP-binding protein n=1 Tax=Murinocardiopsis flavida TaxID=645275 RepID=A0A2P8CZ39_9ACTN|nr:ABC transporter ATP-binding protein [Murinocardiopsis flavida]PSK90242.1 putative ABC transport system ATP-binding protein [Murinocardiopsis flavida]